MLFYLVPGPDIEEISPIRIINSGGNGGAGASVLLPGSHQTGWLEWGDRDGLSSTVLLLLLNTVMLVNSCKDIYLCFIDLFSCKKLNYLSTLMMPLYDSDAHNTH